MEVLQLCAQLTRHSPRSSCLDLQACGGMFARDLTDPVLPKLLRIPPALLDDQPMSARLP